MLLSISSASRRPIRAATIINLLIIPHENEKRKAGAPDAARQDASFHSREDALTFRTWPRGWKVINLLQRIHARILRSGIPLLESKIRSREDRFSDQEFKR